MSLDKWLENYIVLKATNLNNGNKGIRKNISKYKPTKEFKYKSEFQQS